MVVFRRPGLNKSPLNQPADLGLTSRATKSFMEDEISSAMLLDVLTEFVPDLSMIPRAVLEMRAPRWSISKIPRLRTDSMDSRSSTLVKHLQEKEASSLDSFAKLMATRGSRWSRRTSIGR
ncbi:hypothetical protein OIY81_3753 [Cryptosporidium canis]|nr:hypothetical protein OIY81_3753 [Cryptosporidium canis]